MVIRINIKETNYGKKQGAFLLSRQDLPGMMKSLKSSYKSRK